MDDIQNHEQKLLAAFGNVLVVEDRLSDVKRRLDEATTLLQQEKTEPRLRSNRRGPRSLS